MWDFPRCVFLLANIYPGKNFSSAFGLNSCNAASNSEFRLLYACTSEGNAFSEASAQVACQLVLTGFRISPGCAPSNHSSSTATTAKQGIRAEHRQKYLLTVVIKA